MILEGYFAFSPEFYKDKTGFYLAEVCKFFCLILNALAAVAIPLDLLGLL